MKNDLNSVVVDGVVTSKQFTPVGPEAETDVLVLTLRSTHLDRGDTTVTVMLTQHSAANANLNTEVGVKRRAIGRLAVYEGTVVIMAEYLGIFLEANGE